LDTRNALQVVATARRADAFFKAMAADFLLREQFVTDPVRVLGEYVNSDPIDPDAIAVGNALVYSVVSNRALVGWLHAFTVRHLESPPTNEDFVAEFSKAVVAAGADDVVASLIGFASSGKTLSSLTSAFPVFELLTKVFAAQGPGQAGEPLPRTTEIHTTQRTTEIHTTQRTTETGWVDPSVTASVTFVTQPATLMTGRVTERIPITRPTVTNRVTEPDVTESMTGITLRATFITGRVTEGVPITQPLVTAATFVTDRYSATQTGPTTQSTDTGPTTRSTDTGPTTRSTDTGPTTQSTDTGPTTRSTDTGPTTVATDTGPGDRFGRGDAVQLSDFGNSHWSVSLFALAVYASELRGKGLLSGAPRGPQGVHGA
jgi:hypothetical protein